MLRLVDSLDDVLVIPGEVEEATTLAWRAKFGKDVLARQRYQVICRIEFEFRP